MKEPTDLQIKNKKKEQCYVCKKTRMCYPYIELMLGIINYMCKKCIKEISKTKV